MNNKFTLSIRLTGQVLERLIADAIMLNLAILAAFVGRLLALLYLENQTVIYGGRLSGILNESLYDYTHSAWLLTLISLSLFWFFGFYTRGRTYRGRYK